MIEYWVFGLTFNSWNGGDENMYKFNGVEQDPSTGNYETLFRGYDPALGRFMQIDPLADFMPGISPYSFGFDNPVGFADPYGLGPFDWLKNLFKRRQNLPGSSVKVVKRNRTKSSGKKGKGSSGNSGRSGVETLAFWRSTGVENYHDVFPRWTEFEDNGDPVLDLTGFGLGTIETGQKRKFNKKIGFDGTEGNRTNIYLIEGNEKILKELVKLLGVHSALRLKIIGNTANKTKNDRIIYGESYEARYQESELMSEIPANLMLKRANAVREALINLGINPNRLETDLGGHYFGDEKRVTSFELIYPDK